MDAAVRRLVASLLWKRTVESQWAVIDEWATEGDVERLSQTARALIFPPVILRWWAAHAVVDRIARLLALTPRLDFARAACRLARSFETRELASLTASGQNTDVCAKLVGAGEAADGEFLTCLVQELVLRDDLVEREPFASFWAAVRTQDHPLGWLPLRLSAIERSIALPSYSVQGMAYTAPGAWGDDVASGEASAPQVAPLARETTAPADCERISSAVATWLQESNGRAETRVFALRSDEPHVPLAALLTQAGLECLGGGVASLLEAISPADAFEIVFAAASTGGAYDHGQRGSYGRLAAWQTVSALVGASAAASFEHVEQLAERSRWLRFETDSGWFYDVAWDIGLASVNADGSRLAVLAATDTD